MSFSALSRSSRQLVLRISLLASLSPLAFASAMPVNTGMAEAVPIESSAAITFSRLPKVGLQVIPGAWETVATLRPENALPATAAKAAVTLGAASWLILPDGIHLLDGSSGRWSHATSPSSQDVRPREMVYQPSRNSVWFYGDGLYRYGAAGHALQKFKIATHATGAIHKVVATSSGLWIAADRGVFLFDEEGTVLRKLVQPQSAESKYVNIAATEHDIWVAGADLTLLHITVHAGRLVAERSAALPFAALAEMSAVGQSLWLLGKRQGTDYKLAYLRAGRSDLNILSGRYYSLQGGGDRLLARYYSTLFEIRPDGGTMRRVNLDKQDVLKQSARDSQILFVGLSYNYKDGCEIVERGRFDISKGWRSKPPTLGSTTTLARR